jgi:hypothetical protein
MIRNNRIGLVVSDMTIFKISANENTLWTLAAMLDFKSAPYLVEDLPMNISGKTAEYILMFGTPVYV